MLFNERWRQTIGYTPAQAAADCAWNVRRDALFRAYMLGLLVPRVSGAPYAATLALYRASKDDAREAVDGKEGTPVPSLTASQRATLQRAVLRDVGLWIWPEPEIARAIGLRDDQVQAVLRLEEDLMRHNREASWDQIEWSFCMEGASAKTLAALREDRERSLNEDYPERWAMTPDEEGAYDAEVQSRPTSFTPNRSIPAWVRSHRRDLRMREVWRFRRGREAAILASLTPDQKARWDALLKG